MDSSCYEEQGTSDYLCQTIGDIGIRAYIAQGYQTSINVLLQPLRGAAVRPTQMCQ